MTGYTYDAGMLIAAERGTRRAWVAHKEALLAGIVPTVPAGVLAQVWRGGPQAKLSLFVKGCTVENFDESQARSVGARAADTGHSDIVDLAVADGALRRRDIVFTSDPDDIARAAGGPDSLVIEPI